jgi:hypothetical protein
MKKTFNIDAYLSEAEERFSGVTGGGKFTLGGDDFSGAGGEDDDSSAEGVQAQALPAKPPIPYQVVVTNSTGSNGTAVVFGANKWLLDPTFGSSAGITVVPSQVAISYLMLLQQSSQQPFETQLIKVSSNNPAQIDQSFTSTTFDASGQTANTPLITDAYVSAYQNQNNRVEIPVNLRIDGNTYISFNVLPAMGNDSTVVTVTFFPSRKVNQAQAVAGAHPVRNYGRADVPFGGLLGYGKA